MRQSLLISLFPLISCLLPGCDDAGADPTGDAVPVADAVPDSGADVLDAGADVLDAAPDAAPDAAVDAGPLGGSDRPALIYVPAGEPPAGGWPLLFVLHGYRAVPELMRRQYPFDRRVDAHRWVVVYPHGGVEADGAPFWQAHERVAGVGEDVPWLLALADEVAARHPIDLQRFFVIGHSNGGAMAQSMACFAPDRVRGFANISGYNITAERCPLARPLTSLHISGAEDESVPYDGPGGAPGVEASAAWWAEAVLGCRAPVEEAPVDFTPSPPGPETAIRRWTDCPPGLVAERWRLDAVGHVIIANDAFLDAVHAAFLGPLGP